MEILISLPNHARPMKNTFRKYRKQIVITSGIIALNLIYGFDPRFTLINILWLLV